ncbi:MAG: lipid-A-disaccharide synthase [Sphingobacteriia bacterium]|nr:lipid-A-disaccharide synthase [Sphingobacteriia bacterium]
MDKIYIIAGEASGDNIGAELIQELKILNPSVEFFGVGGVQMEKAGLKSLFPMHKLSVMGFLEVVPKIPEILKLINLVSLDIAQKKPKIVITIDSPDFNFRVAKNCKPLLPDIKFVHIVAPSVWAYRQGRAKKIAKIYDYLLCFLPFEPNYFIKYGLKSTFIGHPSIDRLNEFVKDEPRNPLSILALPGSRMSEIKRLWPIYLQVFTYLKNNHKDIHFIVPTISHIKEYLKKHTPLGIPVKFITDENEKFLAYNKAKCALVKSGTISLELAIFKIPMIVTYKVGKITGWLARRLLKVKYVSLINILADKEIIPEFLQEKAEAHILYEKIEELIKENNIPDYTSSLEKLKNPKQLKSLEYGASIINELLN